MGMMDSLIQAQLYRNQEPMNAMNQLTQTLTGIINERGKRDFTKDVTQYAMNLDEVTPDAIRPVIEKYPGHEQEVMKIMTTIGAQKEAQNMKEMGYALHSLIMNTDDLSSLKDPKKLQTVIEGMPWKNDSQKQKFITSGFALKALEAAKADYNEKQAARKVSHVKLGQGETAIETDASGKPTGNQVKGAEKIDEVYMTSPDRKTKVKIKESEIPAYEQKGYTRGEPTALDAKPTEAYKVGQREKFIRGDKEIYQEYIGNGQWKDVPNIGGDRYKPETTAKEPKKQTEVYIDKVNGAKHVVDLNNPVHVAWLAKYGSQLIKEGGNVLNENMAVGTPQPTKSGAKKATKEVLNTYANTGKYKSKKEVLEAVKRDGYDITGF